jgi:protein-S-isoprenylcysteine O-methyltransferase Ste14
VLFALWRSMGGVVWSVENDVGRFVLLALFGFGWTLVLICTFLINHDILVAIQLEERDLVREHGVAYEDYRRRVPMMVPFTGPRRGESLGASTAGSAP